MVIRRCLSIQNHPYNTALAQAKASFWFAPPAIILTDIFFFFYVWISSWQRVLAGG